MVGDFNNWTPSNHDYDFTLNQNGLWELNIDLPQGDYGYKVLESDDWDENDWPLENQTFTVGSSDTVKLLANCGFYTGAKNGDEFVTHLAPIIVGNFLDTLGLGSNWTPQNTAGTMSDEDGDGVYILETTIPAGDWEYKVVLNQNWDQDTFGNGGNFNLSSDGISGTVFHYDFRQNSTYYTTIDLCGSGDVNSDGGVDVLDVVALVNIVLGNSDPSDLELCAADYNGDGTVDILDIVAMVNMILGG